MGVNPLSMPLAVVGLEKALAYTFGPMDI